MNIKITIPRETAIKGGKFFNEICEACNRGSVLEWNEDYTKASLIVDTKAFLDIDNVKDILTAGGEVENYPFEIIMTEEQYDSSYADENVIKSLPSYTVAPEVSLADIPEEDLNRISIESPETKDTFKFNNLFKLTQKLDNGNIKVTSSYNLEYLPASAVFSIFKDFEIK